MKPIIVTISKDKKGSEYVTITREELDAAIDGAYQAGLIDGRQQAIGGLGYGADFERRVKENERNEQ